MKKSLILSLTAALLLTLSAGCQPADDPKPELTRGVWENDTYSSEYAGLTFALPEGWSIATDEDIASLMSISSDLMAEAGMAYSQEMLELQTIYDMMAQDTLGGSNIIVMYENLSLAANGGKLTEDEYIGLVKEQLETAMAAYFTYEFDEVTDATVCGQAFRTVRAGVTTNGVAFEQQYYARKVDKYMLSIIVTLFGAELDDVMGRFS